MDSEPKPKNLESIPDVNKALEAAVSAIYFDDSADYETALWKVIEALDPEILKKLDPESGDDDSHDQAYNEVKKRVDPNYKP